MRSRFCAGVTWAQDQSSYNMFVLDCKCLFKIWLTTLLAIFTEVHLRHRPQRPLMMCIFYLCHLLLGSNGFLLTRIQEAHITLSHAMLYPVPRCSSLAAIFQHCQTTAMYQTSWASTTLFSARMDHVRWNGIGSAQAWRNTRSRPQLSQKLEAGK